MSDSQNSTVFELLSNHILDDCIVFNIDIGSSFVNKDDLAVFEKSSADTKQLFFSG